MVKAACWEIQSSFACIGLGFLRAWPESWSGHSDRTSWKHMTCLWLSFGYLATLFWLRQMTHGKWKTSWPFISNSFSLFSLNYFLHELLEESEGNKGFPYIKNSSKYNAIDHCVSHSPIPEIHTWRSQPTRKDVYFGSQFFEDSTHCWLASTQEGHGGRVWEKESCWRHVGQGAEREGCRQPFQVTPQ